MKKVYIDGKETKSTWGMFFTENSVTALMTPAPKKDAVESTSRLQNGTRSLMDNSLNKYDKRELTLEMHISGATEDIFMSNYYKFCNDVLNNRWFTLTTDYMPGEYFRFRYDNCQQFSEWFQQIGMFMLKLTEEDPTNRGEVDLHITEYDD